MAAREISWILRLLLVGVSCGGVHGALSFASYYANSMVLQAEPGRAVVWGFADDMSLGQQVTVEVAGIQHTTTIRNDSIPGRATWTVTLDAQSAGGPHTLRVSSSGDVIELADVMFGDIWICSGQSNMEYRLKYVDNAESERLNASSYQNVRFFRTGHTTSSTPLYDVSDIHTQWSRPDYNSVAEFSGICWLFGRRLNAQLNKPIGLVQSTWGGTRIEVWSSPDALAKCPDSARFRRQVTPTEDSTLWNAMIHPFLPMTITGAIWYQGESNAITAPAYNCSFPAMITDWRQKFHQRSAGQTDNMFPFGFVQLAPNGDYPTVDYGFPDIRWTATASSGYTPNPVLQRVFMAVAMDLPDFDSPFGSNHPRYKQDIGKRLAISGLSVAYGIDMGRWHGPLPSHFKARGNGEIEILFEEGNATLLLKNGDAYEICCSPKNANVCDEDNAGSTWVVTSARLEGTSSVILDGSVCDSDTTEPQGMRYAWRESPCLLHACSVYSPADENEMPAPPYIYKGNFK